MSDFKLKESLVSLEDIAQQLIKEKYLLTALELYTESIEMGKEIVILRDYFSNSVNFEKCLKTHDATSGSTSLNRSSSQTTLDSFDWARYSEDGERGQEDKIAILEFELRKAQKTIQSLRDNLTQATASFESGFGLEKVCVEEKSSVGGAQLKPHETAAMNFLVNEYLVSGNFKMTANTFADENDQDFEKWDDVGLNIPRPPPLSWLLREKAPNLAPKHSSAAQTYLSDLGASREELLLLQGENAFLKLEIERLKSFENSVRIMSDFAKCTLDEAASPRQSDASELVSFDKDKVEVGKNSVKYEKSATNDTKNSIDATNSRENMILQTHEINSNPALEGVPELGLHDPPVNLSIEDSVESSKEALSNAAFENAQESSVKNARVSVDERRSCLAFAGFGEGGGRVSFSPVDGISEALLDPRKCDRLPPLGASCESSPQALSAGEFISAQRNEAKMLLKSTSSRQVPEVVEYAVFSISVGSWSEVDSRLQNELVALSLGRSDLLSLVSSSLHNIAPNVILAKREELLPLLVYSISNHPDEKERERLLHLLFNLTKRPDKEQRGAILLGLACLARVFGPEKLEAELLPQCWQQLSHKYVERRLLVAQSVAALAPYTPVALRNSLLLSMLMQLLESGGEKERVVRDSALASLSLLTTYMEDEEKLQSLMQILICCLENDGIGDEVRLISGPPNLYVFLTSMASWCVKSKCLSSMFSPLLDRQLDTLIKLKLNVSDENGNRVSPLRVKLLSLVRALNAIIPFFVMALAEELVLNEALEDQKTLTPSSADISLFLDELSSLLGCERRVENLLYCLHRKLFNSGDSSSHLMYLNRVLMPKIIEIVSNVEVSYEDMVVCYVNFFGRLSTALGSEYRDRIMAPLIDSELKSVSADLEHSKNSNADSRSVFLVIKAVAILAEQSPSADSELQSFLSTQIVNFSMTGRSSQSLELVISLLIDKNNLLEDVLSSLWSAVVNKEPAVRIQSAGLWNVIIGRVKESQLSSRIVPALVTLATDPVVEVRAAVINPLAHAIASSVTKEIKDKVALQLETVCDEYQVLANPCLQIALARTCSTYSGKMPVSFLQNLLLPLLCRAYTEGVGSASDKFQFASALLETLRALSSSLLPDHLITHFILPVLHQLQDVAASSPDHMNTVAFLTKEYTSRAHSTGDRGRSQGAGHLGGLGSSLTQNVSAVASLSPGVEDMKTRMSKMGKMISAKTSGSPLMKGSPVGIPSLFKKK